MRRFLIFIGILALFVLFGQEGWVRWYRLRAFENKLAAKNQDILSQNKSLVQEIHDLKDAKFLQYYIHDVMGFVKDNEVIFELPQGETRNP